MADSCRAFFTFFCRQSTVLPEQLHLHAEREAENVAHRETLVGHLADEVQLAGAQLVEEGDVAHQLVAGTESEPLPHEEVGPHLGTEVVVFVGIASRLLLPELLARNGCEVESAVEGFRHPVLLEADAPGNVVLLYGEGEPELLGIFRREKTHEKVRFPLAAASVVPAYTHRVESHPSGVLPFQVSGFQAFPSFIAQVRALVPPPFPDGRGDRVILCLQGQECHRGQSSHQYPFKNRPLHTYSRRH